MCAYNNKHSLISNVNGYGGKTHQNDSQNSDTIAGSGRELYHLMFSLQAASPETFGYTFVCYLASMLRTANLGGITMKRFPVLALQVWQ
jgi:hypothetical protein